MYQIKVDKKKKIALIDLNAFFYPMQSVQETAKAFQGICKAKLLPEGQRLVVELKPLRQTQLRLLALNFCNYCLALRQGSE